MRKSQLVATALAAILLLAGCGGAPAAEWKDYSDTDAGFSVLMPGTPKQDTKPVTSAGASSTQKSFAVDLGNRAFTVSFTDFPADMLGLLAQQLPSIIGASRDGTVKSLADGKLISQKDITVSGFPGHEFSVAFKADNKDAVYKSRIVMANNRMFIAAGVAVDSKDGQAEVDKFLDSFKVTLKKADSAPTPQIAAAKPAAPAQVAVTATPSQAQATPTAAAKPAATAAPATTAPAAATKSASGGTFDTDYPLPPVVETFVKLGPDAINFQTDLTIKQALQFYRDQFTKKGLKERTILTLDSDQVGQVVMDGDKSGQAVVVQLTPLGPGKLNVNIRKEKI